jgi:hypothetical protein
MSYDAALRREEICSLETTGIDPAHRMLRIRAEKTKNRTETIVPYSPAKSELLGRYLPIRRAPSRERGPLFLSESYRNHGQPNFDLDLVQSNRARGRTVQSASFYATQPSASLPQYSSCSTRWTAKQEKLQLLDSCFFLTSPFIELTSHFDRPWVTETLAGIISRRNSSLQGADFRLSDPRHFFGRDSGGIERPTR